MDFDGFMEDIFDMSLYKFMYDREETMRVNKAKVKTKK